MTTVIPKKGHVNKKLPEIERFKLVLKALDVKTSDISKETEIPERTINNYIWKNTPLGGQLLRHLNTKYNVSLDWLLCDRGVMFLSEVVPPIKPADESSAAEQAAGYAASEKRNPRLDRIVLFIKEFFAKKNADEQAWLEIQLKMHLPPYARFLERHHDEW